MKDWRETEGASVHQGLASPTEYNNQRAEWRVPISRYVCYLPLFLIIAIYFYPHYVIKRRVRKVLPLVSDFGHSKLEELSQAIKSCQAGGSETTTQDVTWRGVFDCIEEAKKTYEKKAEDNRFRGWIRKGDAAIGILERLSDIIPDQDGLSILRTGLAFVFQVGFATREVLAFVLLTAMQQFQKRLSNVGNILQELDDVPGVLASISQISNVYRGEVRLKNLVWDFYGILVDCLTDLVCILNRTYKNVGGKNRICLE